jgi:hypothetical protein
LQQLGIATPDANLSIDHTMYRSPPEPVYESDDILSDDGSTFPLDLDDLGMLTVDPYDDQLSYGKCASITPPIHC